MYISQALNQMRPDVKVQEKRADDFNRPKVTFAGKTYDPQNVMYEAIRRMILDRYRGNQDAFNRKD